MSILEYYMERARVLAEQARWAAIMDYELLEEFLSRAESEASLDKGGKKR